MRYLLILSDSSLLMREYVSGEELENSADDEVRVIDLVDETEYRNGRWVEIDKEED